MAYSELIKNFANIRDYISQFYLYGFRSRREYGGKSARSYDNERRRIESWLGEYMSFSRSCDGKSTFLSVDSRRIARNPLYKAFKAKTFTARDIMLHFYILDILADGAALSAAQIADITFSEYLQLFDGCIECDESTVRKKLSEYERLGLLVSEKQGRRRLYRLSGDMAELTELYDALLFFSEIDPIGVIGSYLLDKFDTAEDHFQFKHHYIMNALESEILYELLGAAERKVKCEAQMFSARQNRVNSITFLPLKVYISTNNGRRYILAWSCAGDEPVLYRLDRIKSVKPLEAAEEFDECLRSAAEAEKYMWGVSIPDAGRTEHIEMTVRVEKGEDFITDRLKREKRNGEVTQLENGDWRYSAEVFDAAELVPWIRTFTGRITGIKCTNESVIGRIKDDLEEMYRMYGTDGESDDLQ